AQCVKGRAPGRLFGVREFFSKAGAVVAGVAAAVGTSHYGPAAPVLTGCAMALVAACALALPRSRSSLRSIRTRWSR
ncbi:transporter, partial [Streptomyces sp. NRRL S-444]